MSEASDVLAILSIIGVDSDLALDARQIDLRMPDRHRPANGTVLDELLVLEEQGLIQRHAGGVGYRWSLTDFGRGALHGLRLALDRGPTFWLRCRESAGSTARYRRVVKARGHFPSEQAALKCLYLVTRSLDPTGRGRQGWAMRWKPALNAFSITFADRFPAAETY
jgi:hypothetical protein